MPVSATTESPGPSIVPGTGCLMSKYRYELKEGTNGEESDRSLRWRLTATEAECSCCGPAEGERGEREPKSPRPPPPLPGGQGCVQSSGYKAALAGAAAEPMNWLFQLRSEWQFCGLLGGTQAPSLCHSPLISRATEICYR